MLHRPQFGPISPRRWLWLGLAVVVLLIAAAPYLAGEPLRRYVEHRMNTPLRGYSVSLGSLRLHPIGFSMRLGDVVVVQDAHPDPPVMTIPALSAGVRWQALLRGKLVAGFTLDRPALYVNRNHLEQEMKDRVPIRERGWQQAVQAIYPLKIDAFTVTDGSITYVEQGRHRPLTVTRLNGVAQDIRNVRAGPGQYPSPVRVEAVVFESGRLLIDGHANFLKEPHAAVKGRIALERLALEYFAPVLARYDVVLSAGVLSTTGQVEYAPDVKVLDVDGMQVDGLRAEYRYHKSRAPSGRRAAERAVEAEREVANKPGVLLKARTFDIRSATVGFVNAEARPAYRVFISDADVSVKNFSNHLSEGTAEARLNGLFMGSGATGVTATFRPEIKGPDFDLLAAIDNTDLQTMNDLLRAYGKFDVRSGVLSVYAELHVKNGWVSGWVKPLVRDIKAYSPEKDKDKPLGEKLREHLVDLAGKILKNRPRQEVATEASIEGPLPNPKASTLQILGYLIQNAFFKAILPGFEHRADTRKARAATR